MHLPFNFSLLEARWRARTLASVIDAYEAALPAARELAELGAGKP